MTKTTKTKLTGQGQPQPTKRPRGRPRKYGKRQNFNFRITDEIRQRVLESAKASGRSLSEEIEHCVEESFRWQTIFGDREKFQARMAEIDRMTEAATQYRAGYGKISTPDGPVYFQPGTHNIPQSRFIDEAAAAAPPPLPPELPPAIREAVRAEVRSAVMGLLEEVGLLARGKKPGEAA
jgi:Arc-like DNA binding domain